MSEFKYTKNVTDEEFQNALLNLQNAIEKKDTAGEWVKFAANTVLLVGKIAVNQLGYAPALELLNHFFGDNKDVMNILRKLLEEKDA